MKVIITGATGFVGKNLSEYLNSTSINVESLSLRDKEWRKQIDQYADAIVHLAGKAHDTSNTSEEKEYFKINTDLTFELFNEFLKSDIKYFFLL
ncbi:NAD-dependent epimerase/dehydratase family protein [Chryseobacterium proteolyticum]|uniref:NAD-dependent epimerase/dehydratase family protein n=1 Tax=Chryseobacterium proteolyticum TaxID=118127 RepID=UPI003983AF1B